MSRIVLTDANYAEKRSRQGLPWAVCERISRFSTTKGNWVQVGAVYATNRLRANLAMCERFATDGLCVVTPQEATLRLGVNNPDWEQFGGKRHPGLHRLRRR